MNKREIVEEFIEYMKKGMLTKNGDSGVDAWLEDAFSYWMERYLKEVSKGN